MMVVVVVIVGLILWISRIGKYADIHLEMILFTSICNTVDVADSIRSL